MARYGFYSQEYHSKYGSVIYSTPNGEEVRVTIVRKDDKRPRKSEIFVGEVVERIRGTQKSYRLPN